MPIEGTFDYWLLAVTVGAVVIAVAVMCAARWGFPYAAAYAFLVPMSGLDFGRLAVADLVAVPALTLGLLGALHRHRAPAPGWLLLGPCVVLLYSGTVAILYAAPIGNLAVYVGSLLLAPLVVCMHGTSSQQLRWLMAAFVLGVAVNAGVAIYDAMTPGLLVEHLGTLSGDLRPAGLTTHSNQLGLLCGMAAPMALHLADRGRPTLWWGTWGLLAGGVLASGSRGAVLGFVIAVALYVVIDRGVGLHRIAQLAVLGGLGVFVAVKAGLTVALDRLLGLNTAAVQGTTASDLERASFAHRALYDIDQHFFTGVGYGVNTAHDYYLTLARSGGVIVAVVVACWALYGLRRGWLAREFPIMPSALAATAMWLVFAVQHNAFYDRFLWFPLGLIAAGTMVAARSGGRAVGNESVGRQLGQQVGQRGVPTP